MNSAFTCSSYTGVSLYAGRMRLDDPMDPTECINRCLESWTEMQRCGCDTDTIYESITEIARKHQLMTGHWMLHIPADSRDLDRTWRKVCHAVSQGLLGRYTVARLLIHFRDPDRLCFYDSKAPDRSNLLSIYTRDYTDKNDVLATENLIREIGIHGTLFYKPMIFSYLHIFGDNRLDIRPTLYKSVWKEHKHRFYIRECHSRDSEEWYALTS